MEILWRTRRIRADSDNNVGAISETRIHNNQPFELTNYPILIDGLITIYLVIPFAFSNLSRRYAEKSPFDAHVPSEALRFEGELETGFFRSQLESS